MGSGRWYRGTQNRPLSKSASLIATWVSRGLWRRRLTGAGLPSTWLRRGGGAPGVACVTAKAWGKQWPQSEDTIYKNEISDETGSVDDHDEVYDLVDKLVIPSQFNYRFFKEIRGLKTALGADPSQAVDDILVICDEYETLRRALEHDLKDTRSIVVTGHLVLKLVFLSRVEC